MQFSMKCVQRDMNIFSLNNFMLNHSSSFSLKAKFLRLYLFSMILDSTQYEIKKYQIDSMNQVCNPCLSSPVFMLIQIEKRPLQIDPIENFLP